MNAQVEHDQRNWMVAGAGALLATALVLVLFHVPPSPPFSESSKAVPANVGFRPIQAKDASVNLLDPTPLFLPTEWNAHPVTLPLEAIKEPGSAFVSYPAQMNFNEDVIRLSFPVTAQVPEKLVDALTVGPTAAAFVGMGRTDFAVEPMAGRTAFIEVTAEGTGRLVLNQRVTEGKPPGDADWQPFELLLVVQPSGMVGQPTLLGAGSGSEQVDAFFQNYLARGLHIGERLSPGFYRIKIGP